MTYFAGQALLGRDAWSEHVRQILESADIPPDTVVEHVTVSVAMYCSSHCPLGVQHADLILLIARAFCAVGDRASATRVLSSLRLHARHVDRWLEILSELHRFPELLPFFSLGVIRPADWAGAHLDRMWTLDLGRLHLSAAERHEIMLYRTVRSIIENMYVFWDAVKGEGVLGLKGLSSFRLSGNPAARGASTAEPDLLEYIAELFKREKELRGWHAMPQLLNLEL